MYALCGAGIAFGLFIALPLVPPESVGPFNELNKELGETYAWPQFVDQVAELYESLPPEDQAATVIFTGSYGQAGAIEVLGAGRIPAAISGHNNYWLWGPTDADGPIIGVGHVDDVLGLVCPFVSPFGTITNDAGLENEEFGNPIWLCVDAVVPLSAVWDDVRHYN